MICILLFNRYIFVSFDFLLNWHHLYPFLGDHFLVVFYSFLECIVVCLGHLTRNSFDYLTLFIPRDFLFYRHSLHVLSVLILDNLFFIRHVVYSTLS